MKPTKVIALDVGEKRIGVAAADSTTKLAYPLTTLSVDGTELESIKAIIVDEKTDIIVVGYPRNQNGETTNQTVSVEEFVKELKVFGVPIVYQDESLTSVTAENQLKSHKKPYQKSDIDAYAASIILTDYMESHHV